MVKYPVSRATEGDSNPGSSHSNNGSSNGRGDNNCSCRAVCCNKDNIGNSPGPLSNHCSSSNSSNSLDNCNSNGINNSYTMGDNGP